MRRLLVLLSLLVIAPVQADQLNAWSPQIEGHPNTVALRGFVDHAQAITGKSFDTKLRPISDGKDQLKFLETVRRGDIPVALLTGSMVGRVAPMADVMRLPFILRNSRQMFGLLEGDIGQDMQQKLDASGLIVLGWYDGGSRAIYSRARLDSVGALKDVKIRVPARRDLMSLVSSLGGQPQEIAYKDVNPSFEGGRIDAAENDLLSYETEGHFKRAPYYYLNNNHIVQFEALVVSKVWWESLPAAQREALRSAGVESAQANRNIWAQRLGSARARLEKEGVKFMQYGDSSLLLSRVATIYRPYMDNPKTRDLLVRLMTARI